MCIYMYLHCYSFPAWAGTKDTSWLEDIKFATVFSQMSSSCSFPAGSFKEGAATELKCECVHLWLHELQIINHTAQSCNI